MSLFSQASSRILTINRLRTSIHVPNVLRHTRGRKLMYTGEFGEFGPPNLNNFNLLSGLVPLRDRSKSLALRSIILIKEFKKTKIKG